MPKRDNVRIDSYLTNYVLGYRNTQFGLINGTPRIPAGAMSGILPQLDDSHFLFEKSGFVRAPGADADRGDFDYNTVTFSAKERTFEVPVDDQLRAAQQSPIDLDEHAAITVAQRLNARLEYQIASLVSTTSDYAGTGTDYVTTGAQAWNGTGNPIEGVASAVSLIVSRTGFSPENIVGVCNYKAFTYLRTNDNVIGNYTSTTPGAANNLSEAQVADALGLGGMLVTKAIYNTAAQGQTESFSYMLGDNAFYLIAAGLDSALMPQAFCAVVEPVVPGYPGAEVLIDRYREEKKKSDIVRGTWVGDFVVLNSRAVHAFTDIT